MADNAQKTKKVKLTQSMGGHVTDPKTGVARNTFVRQPGDIVDLPIDEADRFLEAGYATLPDNTVK